MAVNPATGQFYTYLHCKQNGDPFYVGKGSYRSRKTCKRSHDFDSRRRNKHHSRIIAKYGAENIKVFVFPCKSEQQAFDDEIQQIAQLRNEGFSLANITNGGEGSSGVPITNETRAKISKANKGRILSSESRLNMSVAHKGKPSNMKGKKHTDAAKIKIRAARAKQVYTPEHRAALSISRKARVLSDETKAKMKAATIAYNKARINTPEIRAKMSASAKARRASDKTRAKMRAAQVSFWASPDAELRRKEMSERTKASWVIRRQKKGNQNGMEP